MNWLISMQWPGHGSKGWALICLAALVNLTSDPGFASSFPEEINPTAPRLAIELPTRGPGGKVRLDTLSKAGETNWISVSSNLVDWTVVGNGVANSNGIFQFEDRQSGQISWRFYRALPQAPPEQELQFGLFINWSNSSFTGRSIEKDGYLADWPSPYANPSQSTETFFNPPGLEEANVDALKERVTDEWVELAKNAGMTHLLLCVKHVDGFCLWDSRASADFCITCSKRREAPMLHSDLVQAASQSCAAKGLKLGFYYCLADQHRRWNTGERTVPKITKLHLTELLGGRYGSIAYVFLDLGYGGMDLKPGTLKYWLTPGQRQDLYDFIHGQGPDPNGSGLPRLGLSNIMVGFNDPNVPFPGDFQCIEQGHPRDNTQMPLEFCIPILSGFYGRHRWFYSTPEQDNRCMSISDLRDYYDRSLDYRAIFDLSVGPGHQGKLRAIDAQMLRDFAQALSDTPASPATHFLINDDGTRINGSPNGVITYGPGNGWTYRARRRLGEYSNDAHVALRAGDYCQYQFTGTAVEFITSTGPNGGSVDIYIDGDRQTPPEGRDLHTPALLPRQVVFARAGLPLDTHTITVVSRMDGPEVVVDAFRVYSGTPQSLSVDAHGCVWMVDSEHLIWTCHPESESSPPRWERKPGTAWDIGCGRSVWKIGTDVPSPSLNPQDYSISTWKASTSEWQKMEFGEAIRIDVASDESVWCVNRRGQIGFFPVPTNSLNYIYAGLPDAAIDVGCQSAGGQGIGKIGASYSMASWTRSHWASIPGEGSKIDIASNGDIWAVNLGNQLMRYRADQWDWKANDALDVGCGANGDIWYIRTNGTIQRVTDP